MTSHHHTSLRAKGLAPQATLHRRAVMGLVALLVPMALATCSQAPDEPRQEGLPRKTYASGEMVCGMTSAGRVADYMGIPVQRLVVADGREPQLDSFDCAFADADRPSGGMGVMLKRREFTPAEDLGLYLAHPKGSERLPADIAAEGQYSGVAAAFLMNCRKGPLYGFVVSAGQYGNDRQFIEELTRSTVAQAAGTRLCGGITQPSKTPDP